MMTEPDPCPFEQAASLSYGEEKEFDLLANVEESSEGKRHAARVKDDAMTLDDLKNS